MFPVLSVPRRCPMPTLYPCHICESEGGDRTTRCILWAPEDQDVVALQAVARAEAQAATMPESRQPATDPVDYAP